MRIAMLLALASAPAVAQETAAPQPSAAQPAAPQSTASVAQIAPPKQESILRTGTVVPVRTLVELTTKKKKLRVGERFNVEVAEAVMLNGQVVIPAGSPGMGEITNVRNKGMWGKSGAIEGRLLYVRVGDRQIRITGAFNDKGVTGTAGVVAAVAFVPIAGFFTTGTSAHIASGSILKGFLDEDLPVTFTTARVEPLAVPAAAPAPVAAPVTAPVAGSAPATGAPQR